MQTIRNGLAAYDLGIIETVAGASGGVRFIPYHTAKSDNQFLGELCERLSIHRVLPGGMIYELTSSSIPRLYRVWEKSIMQRSIELKTPVHHDRWKQKAFPWACLLPRRSIFPWSWPARKRVLLEGLAVSISYLSGSTKKIQSMSLPKKPCPMGPASLSSMTSCVPAVQLTACANCRRSGPEVVGVYLFIAAKEPAKKLVREYASLLTLRGVDETSKAVDIVPEML